MPPMTKHAGKAAKAGIRILFWTLIFLLALLATGALAIFVSQWIVTISDALVMFSGVLAGVWLLFAAFTLYFFRDPKPVETALKNAVVAPAHGKVDVIDETAEAAFMGGPCRRISIFLSVFDVHVQRAPMAGRLDYIQHKEGKFLSATKTHSAEHNENVLMGFSLRDFPGGKISVRLIAGLLARRIIPWTREGEEVERGERISLIQFGSRCDLYLRLETKLLVNLGDRVKGGETIVASFD
jgi:phosphatidylserine decarboxylase